MKISRAPAFWLPARSAQSALTLVEMMFTLTIFSMMIVALVYTNIFGLRQDELVESMLGSSDSARRSLNDMVRDIHSAKIWRVGSGSFSTFSAVATNALQTGNALQLSLSYDTNTYIRYYFDTNAGNLYRMHSGDTSGTLLASALTNTMYFAAEDYTGTVKSDITYRYLIHAALQYAEYQYPQTKVGSNYLFSYYRMDFRATPHAPSPTL